MASFCTKRLSRISNFMQKEVDSGHFAGISTLVAHKGDIVHFDCVGYQDRETKTPMQKDTLFRLYSMTKPVICAAIMILYEQGKFDLFDPVSKFIPAFANLKVYEQDASGKACLVDLEQPVTISHLLSHTSGLLYDVYSDHPVCEVYRKVKLSSQVEGVSLEAFVDKLCTLPLGFQPGSDWYYSVSIDVLARVIEIITEQPLQQFLSEALFKPLGMNDTSYFVPENKRHRVATVYGGIDIMKGYWPMYMDVWERGVNQPLDVSKTDPIDDPKFSRGGYGLLSTTKDYFHFAQMFLNQGELNGERILSRKTIDLMHTNLLKESMLPIHFQDINLQGYGFGLGSRVLLDVAATQLPGSIGEFGWAGAATTYYWVDPKEELIGLFMSQYMLDFSMVPRQFQALVYQSLL